MGFPNVFDYDNYRLFLKDAYESLKAKDKKFSFRFFARLAGFSSHNTLWNVIHGRDKLSESGAERVSKALKLHPDETKFFKTLVQLNQAKNTVEKAKFSKDILTSKAYKKAHPLREAQLRYYTHWYYVVVREMVGLPNFKEDTEWIAANTLPAVTPKQAGEALDELQKLGFLKRDENGRLIQTDPLVFTSDEVTSGLVAQFHREFMKKASESIDLIPRELRDISSVTIQVSKETAKRLKEKVQEFRRILTEEAVRDPHPETIYQLNLQLFPVTQMGPLKNRGGQEK